MRVVLAMVWLMALCLPVSAAETVQRFDTNGDGQRSINGNTTRRTP